jgi:hypothetical protein
MEVLLKAAVVMGVGADLPAQFAQVRLRPTPHTHEPAARCGW